MADYEDPNYMINNPQTPLLRTSTDDFGGTLDTELMPIARGGPARRQGGNRRREEEIEADYPTFTGGTYLHPEFLPPTHQAFIQGGRFVNPEAEELLPPVREYTIEGGRYVQHPNLPPLRSYKLQ